MKRADGAMVSKLLQRNIFPKMFQYVIPCHFRRGEMIFPEVICNRIYTFDISHHAQYLIQQLKYQFINHQFIRSLFYNKLHN